MSQKVAAVILAGGKSSRFSINGSDIPNENKIFSQVGDLPLIVRTVSLFVFLDFISDVFIVCNRNDQIRIDKLLYDFSQDKIKPIHFVNSGETRALSSKNAIEFAYSFNEFKYILITDAARCSTPVKLIHSVYKKLEKYDNAIPCIRHEETFKVIQSGRILDSFKKSNMYEIQTPQGYRLDKLMKAYSESFDEFAADESEIYFNYYKEEPFNIVQGHPTNIKITRITDLLLI